MSPNFLEIILGIVLCLGTTFMCVVGPALFLLALAREDYRSVRQLIRQRRIGLAAALLLTAVVAVALGFLRALPVEFTDPAMLCLGVVALGAGIVIVGIAWLMCSDTLERAESSKLRNKFRTPDVKIELPDAGGEIPPTDEEANPSSLNSEP